jgi:hypothetical protein
VIFFVGSATGVLTLPPSPEPALATPLEPASPAPELPLLPAATPLEPGLPPELELPPEAGFAEAPLLALVGPGFPLELPLGPVPLLGGPLLVPPPVVAPPLLVAPPVPVPPVVGFVPLPDELPPPLDSIGLAVPPGAPDEVA